MTINGINGAYTQMGQMGMNQAADSYSRNIQNQIANAQKQLQELSSDENMTLEEKMKKRQEIQQQISDLNMQLRQHQTEQRREKQQTKSPAVDDMFGSAGNMTAMLSADSLMKQAKVQGSVATSMKGRAGVLESEIKNNHGADVEQKKEELADVTQKLQAATASQMSALADVNKAVEKTAQAENTEEKKEDMDANTADEKENDTAVSETAAQPIAYTPVDIRL